MPERIRVGIVGASPQSWAAATHLPALAHLDEFTVTAVATTRQDSARAAADTFGIRHAFASADELASHPEVDLVVVSVKGLPTPRRSGPRWRRASTSTRSGRSRWTWPRLVRSPTPPLRPVWCTP